MENPELIVKEKIELVKEKIELVKENIELVKATESPVKAKMEEKKGTEYLHKIMVVGDIGTGKTAFVKRLVHGIFSIHYKATIGVDFALKVKTDDNDIFRLQMWDIAGQERFGNMTRVYYKEAIGAFVVADATRPATIDGAVKWKRDLDAKNNWTELYPQEINPVILLVNKIDLLDADDLAIINYDDFCKANGFHSWIAMSAKDSVGGDKACSTMIDICKKAKLPVVPVKETQKPPECVKANTTSPPEKEMNFCDLLKDLLLMLDGHGDDKTKIKHLRSMLFTIFFDPMMEPFRKKMRSDEQSREIIKGIADQLVDASVNDTEKITNILNFLLECGMKQLEPLIDDTIVEFGKLLLKDALSTTDVTVRINTLDEYLKLCKKYPDDLGCLIGLIEDCMIDAKLKPLW